MSLPFQHLENLVRDIETIGDGIGNEGLKLIGHIAERLRHARNKHPVYAKNMFEVLEVIKGELEEFEHAICYETPDRQYDEALDLIAVLVRFCNDEENGNI